MSLKLFALIAPLVWVIGLVVGYYLRLVISLGKKGTVEIEIKEMLLKAKEEAKKITLDAENKDNKYAPKGGFVKTGSYIAVRPNFK